MTVSQGSIGNFGVDVGSDAVGNLIVTWTENTNFGFQHIAGRLFDANGNALGATFSINQSGFVQNYGAGETSVAATSDGSFVVVWSAKIDGEVTRGVFARLFSAAGIPQSDEFRIDAMGGVQPSVAMDTDGNFVVVWAGQFDALVRARTYGPDGTSQGDPFPVSTTGIAAKPKIDGDEAGHYVVAWTAGDADGAGVFAELLEVTPPVPARPLVFVPGVPGSELWEGDNKRWFDLLGSLIDLIPGEEGDLGALRLLGPHHNEIAVGIHPHE